MYWEKRRWMKDFSDRPGDDAAAGDEGDAVDDAGG